MSDAVIIGNDVIAMWHSWLVDAGIVHDGDNVTRVVVDVAIDEVVRVTVEKYGVNTMEGFKPPKELLDKCKIVTKEWVRQ